MRFPVLVFGFLGCISAASAADDLYRDARQYDSTDYAAQAFYRLTFGSGSQSQSRQMLGFQVVNEKANAIGAPALVRAEFNSTGLPQVTLNGVNLSHSLLVARQNDGGMLGSLTVGEIITVVAAVAIVGLGTYEATQSDDTCTPSGSGTGATGC